MLGGSRVYVGDVHHSLRQGLTPGPVVPHSRPRHLPASVRVFFQGRTGGAILPPAAPPRTGRRCGEKKESMAAKLIQAARGARLYSSEIGNRFVPIITIQNDAGLYAGVALDARALILGHTVGHATEGAALSELLAEVCKVKAAEQ